MNYKSTAYVSFDGIKLSGYVWEPKDNPKAVINLVHGFGEYSERYDHWAMKFVEKGIAVHAIDNRGHGKSDGRRGYLKSFDHFLKDVDVLIQESTKRYPNLPQLIYGHSMGGNIVANYVLRRNSSLVAAIISSPWLQLTLSPSALTIFFARIVKQLFPKFTQKANLDVKGISHDKEIINKYIDDSLIHEKISPQMFLEIYHAGNWAIQNADKLMVPALIQHGTSDLITSFKASKQFFENAQKNKRDIVFKEWEGLYHELHNELEKDQVFECVISWINKKLERG